MEEIKNFIYSHSSPNGCVALTRSERDELVGMVEELADERNENAAMLILAIDDHISQSPFIKPEHIESAKMYYFESLKERARTLKGVTK